MTERFFNTSGPVVPAKHYNIPPLERFDLDEILRLIRDERYFVLHAPRQTGKTSALLALRDLLNEEGEYRCVYANVEAAQTARGDVARGMQAILGELRIRARVTFRGDPGSGLEDLARGARRIANPIYREVIPRELMYAREDAITHETEWYVKPDGALDVESLLAAFQRFFREHSEHWIERFQYKEAGPQLLLQAFLQRIVNGGGRIEREYALGSRRTDLLIVWPPGRLGAAAEPAAPARRYVVECRILRGGLEATIREGLEQTLACMDRCAGESGHLVVFDRDESKPWEEKIFRRDESLRGRPVTVWGA